jgi:hypothetical protein
MSPDLSDLLLDLADGEARHAAAAGDPAAELRSVLAGARRVRARRLTVTVTASTAVVALAVTAATALPVRTDDAPVADDAATSASPTATATDAPVATDPSAAPIARGLLASLDTAPSTAWTVSTTDLVPGSDTTFAPRLAQFSAGAPLGAGAFAVAAGDVWVLALADTDLHIVGVDPAEGTFQWELETDPAAPEHTTTCGGADRAGQLVCVGVSATDGPVVQLVDPVDGHVARRFGLDMDAQSVAVSGDVAVAHGVGPDGAPRWQAISTRTAEPLWSGTDPEPVVPPAGSEPPHQTVALGDVFVLESGGHQRVLDVLTGEPAVASLPLGIGLDTAVGSETPGVRFAWDAELNALSARRAADDTPMWEVPDVTPHGVVPGFVVTGNVGALSVRDALTGAERWQVAGAEPIGYDGTRLVVTTRETESRLVTGFTATDLTSGATTWTLPVDTRDVVVVGGQLLLDGGDTLTALRR